MKPLTNRIPKCLTEINGIPILVNTLNNLEKKGIKEIILVVGYLENTIRQKIGKEFGRIKINYVVNSIYDRTNTSYSLWLAVKDLNEPILILEGDVFFENNLIEKFLADKRSDLTILERYNSNLDGSFVSLDKDKIVTSWVHKKDRPEGFTLEDKYKTVNIHKFSKNFVNKWLIPFLRQHVKENNGESPLEFVFRDIIKEGGIIEGFVTNDKWFEIDDIKDLKIAEKIFKNA